VFVSSTVGEQGELAEERRAVARAISALRLTPVLFELGARPYPPLELYRAYLAQSDVFIGLYWQRYGRVGPGMQISGLEEELELARAGALPRLLYVKTPAPDREPRLAELLDRVKQDASDSYRYVRLRRPVRPREARRAPPRPALGDHRARRLLHGVPGNQAEACRLGRIAGAAGAREWRSSCRLPRVDRRAGLAAAA
jgi:hypothetical protein